jgi:hypothetical protein
VISKQRQAEGRYVSKTSYSLWNVIKSDRTSIYELNVFDEGTKRCIWKAEFETKGAANRAIKKQERMGAINPLSNYKNKKQF